MLSLFGDAPEAFHRVLPRRVAARCGVGTPSAGAAAGAAAGARPALRPRVRLRGRATAGRASVADRTVGYPDGLVPSGGPVPCIPFASSSVGSPAVARRAAVAVAGAHGHASRRRRPRAGPRPREATIRPGVADGHRRGAVHRELRVHLRLGRAPRLRRPLRRPRRAPPTPTAASPVRSRWARRCRSRGPSTPGRSSTAPGRRCSATGRDRRQHLRLQRLRPGALDARDHQRVNPSIPHWGGPTALGTSTLLREGLQLRQLLAAARPRPAQAEGGLQPRTVGTGGTTRSTPSTPGIPGDSGSAFLDSSGRAVGVLSTLAIAPLAASNGVSRTSPWRWTTRTVTARRPPRPARDRDRAVQARLLLG
jgi:hypothetical protein